MGMYEIDEAAKAITEAADSDANIIFGAIIDEAMSGEIKITVIATGFDVERMKEKKRPEMITSTNRLGMNMGMGIGQQRPTPMAEPTPPPPQPQVAPETEEEGVDEEDELEVPAFIRRKLK